jgi:CBS domain-containing protein
MAMKTIRQLLQGKSQGVLAVPPEATVFDALKLMSDKDVGSLLVMQGEKLVGIFSERDYARKVILQGKSSFDTKIREIMTERVICVSPKETVEQCMALMTEKRCRHLPVVEDGKVVGVLSIGDMVKETISEQRFIIEQLESYIMS